MKDGITGKAHMFGQLKGGHIQVYELYENDVSLGVFRRWRFVGNGETIDFLPDKAEGNRFHTDEGFATIKEAIDAKSQYSLK